MSISFENYDSAIRAYVTIFGEAFPVYSLPQMGEKETIEFIQKCIAEGKRARSYYSKNEEGWIY